MNKKMNEKGNPVEENLSRNELVTNGRTRLDAMRGRNCGSLEASEATVELRRQWHLFHSSVGLQLNSREADFECGGRGFE